MGNPEEERGEKTAFHCTIGGGLTANDVRLIAGRHRHIGRYVESLIYFNMFPRLSGEIY